MALTRRYKSWLDPATARLYKAIDKYGLGPFEQMTTKEILKEIRKN